jgi:hypothetical protein
MNRVIFTVLFLLLSCFFSQATFADYPGLVGREISLHGPYSWQRLGVALNEKMADDIIYAYRMRDKTAFLGMLESYDVLRVTKDAKVLVLDAEVFKGKAHVVLTSGLYKGMSGWVPIEWLKGNDQHYLIGEVAEENKI